MSAIDDLDDIAQSHAVAERCALVTRTCVAKRAMPGLVITFDHGGAMQVNAFLAGATWRDVISLLQEAAEHVWQQHATASDYDALMRLGDK